MKHLKIISLALLTLIFYAEGTFNDNSVFVWCGHIAAIFTIIYGYAKLFSNKDFTLSIASKKTYGIFDLVITLGLFYFLFHISYFDHYSSVESFLLISAIMLIIVGKVIYYYRKEFSSQTA